MVSGLIDKLHGQKQKTTNEEHEDETKAQTKRSKAVAENEGTKLNDRTRQEGAKQGRESKFMICNYMHGTNTQFINLESGPRVKIIKVLAHGLEIYILILHPDQL